MGNSWKGLNIYTINFLSNCLSFDSPKHYRPYQQDVVRHEFTADLKNIKTSQNLYIYIHIMQQHLVIFGYERFMTGQTPFLWDDVSGIVYRWCARKVTFFAG